MTNNCTERSIRLGEEFTIKIESNPTTGYSWQPGFDQNVLRLISSGFTPTSKLMGAAGTERFTFKAISQGRTTVKMIYKRVWEKKPRNEKEFCVIVT